MRVDKPKLILAEKPQVARDLARVLGVPTKPSAGGAFVGPNYTITWCVGHLIELEEPATYQAAWKRWSFATLPMIPEVFQLRPVKTSLKQWKVVRGFLRDKSFASVINACDAGREGELIFRFCYELAGSRLPIERLWVSSLTDQAIQAGMAQIRPGSAFQPLADAARCRAEADWLVGMNATRAVTLKRRATQDVLCSIGRVQTPTLALLCRRERQIENFIPRRYYEVHAELRSNSPIDGEASPFRAVYFYQKLRRIDKEESAREIRDRSEAAARLGQGPVVETIDKKRLREPPPLLFDLTALQRTANKRFGFSAHRTLQIAQALYEEHKLLTYPRTDCRYLTSDLIVQLPAIFAALAKEPLYGPLCAPLLALAAPPAPKRVFQDSKARDHHAIIPTALALIPSRLAALSKEERDILDLVIRRFLSAFYPDAEFEQTRVVIVVGPVGPVGVTGPAGAAGAAGAMGTSTQEGPKKDPEFLQQTPPPPDRYEARGRVRILSGWQAVSGFGDGVPSTEGDGETQTLPKLTVSERLVGEFQVAPKETRPPPRFTEATLLSAMEAAGQHIDSEELRQEMKDVGLGTPATRAAIIETLIQRTYLVRQGKDLIPTALGLDLIEKLPLASLASPELTGSWEARLSQIARGQESRSAFMADIADYVHKIIEALRAAPTPDAVAMVPSAEESPKQTRGRRGKEPRKRTQQWTRTSTRTGTRTSTRTGTRTGTRTKASAKKGSRVAAPLALLRGESPAPAHKDAPTRTSLAEQALMLGTPVTPPLLCPRCKEGNLLIGRRGWGCERYRNGCPLVIPFEVLGHRLTEHELRDIVLGGASSPISFRPPSGTPLRGRLRLASVGSPLGYVYLEPLA